MISVSATKQALRMLETERREHERKLKELSRASACTLRMQALIHQREIAVFSSERVAHVAALRNAVAILDALQRGETLTPADKQTLEEIRALAVLS